MVSDFRRKKLLHLFTKFFDNDDSGHIEKKDFEIAVERIAKLRGWSAGDAKYKATETTLMKIWDGIQSCADGDKDGKVSQEEWLSMWDNYVKKQAAAEWQNVYCKFVFDVQDAGGDGAIDKDEFITVQVSFGIDKNDADAAFQKMAKGKSSVSWGEFQELWKEYFSSEDVNAPGNFIFSKTSY